MISQCSGVCKSKFKKVTHVIFDLDGTILDTEGLYGKAISDIASEYGKVCTDEILNKVKGSVQEETARISIELMDLPLTIDEFLEKFRRSSDKLLEDVDYMPGAEKVIRHLRENNIPIAVATSSPQDSFDIKTSKHKEVFALFDHIVCGGTDPEVKRSKPAPDIFVVCASRFRCKPKAEECLVFEDSPNGVKGAIAAGMQVIMIPDSSVPYDIWKLATLRLDSFNDMVFGPFGLPPIIKQ